MCPMGQCKLDSVNRLNDVYLGAPLVAASCSCLHLNTNKHFSKSNKKQGVRCSTIIILHGLKAICDFVLPEGTVA